MAKCVEIMCDCMSLSGDSATADECACDVMGILAVECHDQDPTVDLSGWRSKYDCLVTCPNGAVYKECIKQTCEVTCENRNNPNACPEIPDLCYPGCVCPDGLILKKDKCVKPIECRDCECDGFGDTQYFSFDRSNFTFNGNCTYIAARDQLLPGTFKIDHDFQVQYPDHLKVFHF